MCVARIARYERDVVGPVALARALVSRQCKWERRTEGGGQKIQTEGRRGTLQTPNPPGSGKWEMPKSDRNQIIGGGLLIADRAVGSLYTARATPLPKSTGSPSLFVLEIQSPSPPHRSRRAVKARKKVKSS